MSATFGLAPQVVSALPDGDFMDLAGRALFLRQQQLDQLERIVTNGVALAFGGTRKRRR